MFGPFQHRSQFDGVGVFDGGADFDEFFDQVVQRAADFLAVLEADFRPHLERSAGDAREILEAGTTKFSGCAPSLQTTLTTVAATMCGND